MPGVRVLRGPITYKAEVGFLPEPPGRWHDVLAELAFRELQRLDTEDLAAVAEFMSEHGLIFPRWPYNELLDRDVLHLDPHPESHGWFDLRVAAAYLRQAKTLAGHVLRHLDGGDPAEVWYEGVPGDPDTTEKAWERFALALNAGLTWLHPRVEGPGPGVVTVNASTDLYGALCLEILDALTEEQPFRTCAHCGNRFRRQQGRANYGQHHVSGVVMYCTSHCAKAANQRKYRQRKREKL